MRKFWERVKFLLRRYGPWIVVVGYISLAITKLDLPAIHYDEAFYINSALGGVDKVTFMTKSVGEIPVLIMPYIGALKSWLMHPVFAMFGVSPVSIRLPSILLTAALLYFMYWLFKKHLGQGIAFCILAITAINASFIAFTRLDFGPIVIDFGLKLAGLWLLLNFVKEPRYRYLLLFWATMLAGEFNKLNFLWYVHAFGLAVLVVYGRRLWAKITPKPRWRYILVSVVGYGLCVMYYLFIVNTYSMPSGLGLVSFDHILSVFRSMVVGSWFYNYALSLDPIGLPIVFTILVALIAVASVLLLPQFKTKVALGIRRLFIFSLVFLAGLLAQMAVTKAATAGWHYFSIYPMWSLLVILGVCIVASRFAIRPWLINASVVAITVAVVGYNLLVYKQYINIYGNPVANASWSDANYRLVSFAKSHHQPFVSLDWGTHTQLLSLDPVKSKYYEVSGPINLSSADVLYKSYITDLPDAYYITHTPQGDSFPQASSDFFKMTSLHGLRPTIVQTFYDGSRPVYTIYKLQQPDGL